MLYKGQFRSIHNDKLYTVNITTGNRIDSSTEITLGPNAFTTTMNQSNNTIYTPVKASSATVQIVSDPMFFDLYSSSAKQNRVELRDASNNIEWVGYTTPNTYSTPFDFEIETYEVECLDALGILQYFDYTPVDGSTRGFHTFAEIIDHILSTANIYGNDVVTNWYWNTNTKVVGNTAANLPDICTISEQNFFDEDDNAMKMNEVLEEICKWAGVTALVNKTSVYFVDYDAIKNNYNSYVRYYIGYPYPDIASRTLADRYSITSSSFMSSGTTLSQDMTYSKATIRDSLYAVKSIMPDMFNNEDLVNAQDYPDGSTNWFYTYTNTAKENDKHIYIKSRHYTNKRFNHFFYTNSGSTTSGPIYNGLTAENKLGASFARYSIGKGETYQKAYNDLDYNYEDYLMLPVNHTTLTGLKKIEEKDEFTKPFFMASNTKFIVKGSMILTDRGTFKNMTGMDENIGYFPDEDDIKSIFTNKWDMAKNLLTLGVKLTTSDSSIYVDVPFYEASEASTRLYESKKNKDVFYHSFKVQNNVTYSDMIDEEGYKIEPSITSGYVVGAKPKVCIYGIDKLLRSMSALGFTCPIGCVFIKDFDIIATIPYEGGVNDNETDTEYEYMIDEGYVSELGDIVFKICTWDNKMLNYSAVAYKTNNKYKFVDQLTNIGLGLSKRSEELLGYKIVEQYKTPAKILDINLEDNILPWTLVSEPVTNSEYIVDSINHNYVYDSCSCRLVEKK